MVNQKPATPQGSSAAPSSWVISLETGQSRRRGGRAVEHVVDLDHVGGGALDLLQMLAALGQFVFLAFL